MVYYYKGSAILAPFKIQSNEPFFDMTSVSLKTHRSTQGVQRWELSFNVMPNQQNTAESFLETFLNIDSSDTLIMPQLPAVDEANTIGLSRPVVAAASAGATSVSINSDGVLSKGSFVKFDNHDKLYVVTGDVTAGDPMPVPIYPRLHKAVTTSDSLKTGAGALLSYYRSIDNVTGITFTSGLLANPGTINLIEAV